MTSQIPLRRTKTINAFVEDPSEWRTTGTVTPLERFTNTASLLISHSMSTKFDNKVAVRITKTADAAYMIRKYTPTAEFSVVTPDQSEFV